MSDPIRILYVDDYPLDRELVRDALEKEHHGFQLIEATSRSDFETRLVQGGFDLILSDFNILGFEGLQVLDTVRAAGLDIPVIIVTGTGSEEVAAEAIMRGAADYVIKTPNHILGLPHIIRRTLEKKQLEVKRLRTEEQLRESEYRYHLVFENSGTANTIFGTDCRVILQNSMSQKLTEPMNVVGKTALEIFGPEQGPMVTERMRRVLTSGVAEVFENEFTNFMEKRWMYSSYQPLFDLDHQVIGIQVISQDITEQKHAEEKLRESEERFRSLYENATIGMYRTSPDGKILMANPSLVRMLGYESFEQLSQRDLDKEGYEPGYPRHEFQNHIEKDGNVRGLESAWKRKDGSIHLRA